MARRGCDDEGDLIEMAGEVPARQLTRRQLPVLTGTTLSDFR
ncbi:MAG TPA: hypothetical protein VGF64_14030 [Acidimicrobiales bacterium]